MNTPSLVPSMSRILLVLACFALGWPTHFYAQRPEMAFTGTMSAFADGSPVVLAGAGQGSGLARVFNGADGLELAGGFPWGPDFRGGVRVAVGDINGDSIPDFIVGTGQGGGVVRAYSGANLALLLAAEPFGPSFTGGVYVAAGDLNADGRADVIVGGGPGSGLVRVYSGADGRELVSGYPFTAAYAGGVTVAAGDVDGDGRIDVITGTAFGGFAQVINGATLRPTISGFPYGAFFTGGINVAAGDIDGDGRDEVVTAAANGDGVVNLYSLTAGLLASFAPFPGANGVTVAVGDLNDDGVAEIITGSGFSAPPRVRIFNYRERREVRSFLPFDPQFPGGVWVAAWPGVGRVRFLTSAAATFRVGVAQEFIVRSSGGATVSLTVEGTLPAGLTFVDRGNGSGVLGGTPAPGTGGVHALKFVATRGGVRAAEQAFTLTVQQAAAITSAAATTTNVGSPGSFTVTSSGFPVPSLAVGGALPGGVTFIDNGNGSGTLSGTPAAGTAGIYNLTFTAANTVGSSAPQAFTLTVNSGNRAPVANADGYSVAEAGTVTPSAPSVLANDTDADGNSLTAILVSNPTNASSFTLNPNGSLSYTHNGSETTSDSFTYKANDGTLDSNVVTVTITITPVNDAPVAVADSHSVAEGGTLTPVAPGVLANDTDAEGSALSAVLVTGPTRASSFTLNASGSFSYTHNGSETTTDAFTYKANDGTLDSNVVTVTITITPVNDAPVAVADNYNVAEAGTLTPAAPGVLVNDTDAEGSALSAVLVTGPTRATSFTLNANGSFSYTHNGSETTSDSFTYTANDGALDSNVVTVTIAITPVNDAPVAGADNYNVAEAGTLTPAAPGVLANDTDAEGTALTAVLVTGPTRASSFTLNPNGSFSYTHNGGETTSDSFTYKANDGALDSNVVTVTIAISATNDAPVAVVDSYNVNEGGSGTAFAPGVLTNDTDAEGSALSAVLVTGPTSASAFTLNADGSFSYTHNGSETTSDSFTYRANDGALNSNIATVTFTITPVNDAPVAVADNYNVAEGGALAPAAPGVLANDTDAEGSGLSAVLVTGPTQAATFTLNANGSFAYTHNGSETISDSFTYKANDGVRDSNVVTVTITITPVNDTPIAVADNYTVAEGGTLAPAAPGVLANDSDAEGGLSAVLVTGPAQAASFTLNANGSFSYTHNGSETTTDSFTYKGNDGALDSNVVTVTITISPVNDGPIVDLDADDSGGTAGVNYAITFTEGDAAKLLADGVDANITDSDSTTLVSLTVRLTNLLDPTFETLDVDLTGAPLAFSKNYDTVTTPGQGILTITAASPQPIANFVTLLRKVTYNNTDQAPNSTARVITVIANDGFNNGPSATATVTIVPVDDAPTATSDSYNAIETNPLSVSAPGVLANDSDVDGDPLTAVLVTGPVNAVSFTLNPDGSFNYTHNGGATTTDSFTYQVSDGVLISNVATVTITIVPQNDPPVAVADAGTTNEDTALTVVAATGVLANDTDPDAGDTKIVAAVNGAGANVGVPVTTGKGATVTVNPDGSYTYNGITVAAFQALGNGQTDSDTFNYTVQDSGGLQSAATVTITINGVNDAPVVDAGVGSASYTENAPPVAIAPALTISDVDDANIESATVAITANYINGQDALAFTNQSGITGVFNNAAGVLTLTGTATVASYQAALRSVAYNNTSDNPSTAARTIQFVVNDGDVNSNTASRTVSVTAINDAPTITAGATITFTEGDAAKVIDNTITVADLDDTNLEGATVHISANYVNGQDVLGFTNQNGITGTFSAATGVMTLTGSATKAFYQTALRSITYFNGSNNPSQSPRTVTWTVNDGDINSAAATSTINVVAVNSGPQVFGETFEVLGNTELRVDMSPGTKPNTTETTTGVSSYKGVLDNDSDPEGDPFAVTAITGCADVAAPFDCTLVGGAIIHVEANGEFSYTPAPGALTGSFTYTVTDTPVQGLPSSVNGTVTFTLFDMIWYVNGNVAGPGTGTSMDPFNTFTAGNLNGAGGAGDLDDADDYIFMHDSTISSGIELEVNQHLIGQFAGLSINRNLNGNGAPTNLVAAGGARPVISSAGYAVSIGTAIPIEITGLALSALVNPINLTTGAALSGLGTLTIANNEIRSAGAQGVDINVNAGTTGTLTLNIQSNTWNTANTHSGNAIDIVRAAGTLNLNVSNNSSIKSNGSGIFINGGNVANTFVTGFANNSIHPSTVSAGVAITNVTFDSNTGVGGFQQVAGGTMAIGITGDGVGTFGMQLLTVQGNLFFDDLDVFGVTGVQVSGTGGGMTFAVTPGTPDGVGTSTITATAGFAVDITNAAIDLRLSSLTSTTPVTGVSLNGVTGQFRAPSGSTITKSSGVGTAFAVANCNTTVTYGGALNVTAGAGVMLTTNTGSTFSFTGSMTLNTGANAAFAATGGGTVTVTGSPNILTTSTATALNVSNTNIGVAGLTFRSIASNGAANGILLNTTGTGAGSGGLTVTGTGAAGTGGTIQNGTIGINLTSTRDVVLNSMQLTTFGDFAIRGSSVVNFTLNGSTINGTNGSDAAADEGSVRFTELTGSAMISNVNISGGHEDNVKVVNTAGTLNGITFNAVTIGANSTANGNDGIGIEASGTAVVNVTVQNSTFTSARGDLFQMSVPGTGSANLTFTGNTLSNNHSAIATGGGGVSLSSGNTSTVTMTLSNNTFRDAIGHAILIVKDVGTGTQTGTFESNQIGVAPTANSGSLEGDGLKIQHAGGGTMKWTVKNNQIRQYNNFGINMQAGAGLVQSGTFANIVTGNTVSNPGTNAAIGTPFQGITLNGGVTPGDTFQIYLTLGGDTTASNTCNNCGRNGGVDYRLRQRQSTTVHLSAANSAGVPTHQYAGGNTNLAQVDAFVDLHNNLVSQLHAVNSPPGGGFVNGLPPLVAAAIGVDAEPDVSGVVVDEAITQSQVDRIVAAAIERLAASGLSTEALAMLRAITIGVTDLQGARLGFFMPGHISLDRKGAGRGWFVDPTPLDDAEFTSDWNGERAVEQTSRAAGRYDLLSTVLHELSHALGLGDREAHDHPGNLMNATLPYGVRRLPQPHATTHNSIH